MVPDLVLWRLLQYMVPDLVLWRLLQYMVPGLVLWYPEPLMLLVHVVVKFV